MLGEDGEFADASRARRLHTEDVALFACGAPALVNEGYAPTNTKDYHVGDEGGEMIAEQETQALSTRMIPTPCERCRFIERVKAYEWIARHWLLYLGPWLCQLCRCELVEESEKTDGGKGRAGSRSAKRKRRERGGFLQM